MRMRMRMRMRTRAGILVLVAGWPLVAAAIDDARAESTGPVEVVFVVDATGSMSGFIDSAKSRIWAIASQLARPGIALRVGLVAFRDRGDEFVTRVVALDDDIGAVEQSLRSLQAAGGGDTPEAVAAALRAAVDEVEWSGTDATARWLLLVGDAPPHDDPRGAEPWTRTVDRARRRGLVVHAIQCGRSPATERVWRDIARRGGGHYVALDPSVALSTRTTPFDAELAALGRQLVETVVESGDPASDEALRTRRRGALSADAATAAERLGFLERRGQGLGSGWTDLVSRAERGEVDVARLDESDWPPDVRGLPEDERRQWLADQVDRRRGLWSEIAWLSRRREARLAEEDRRRREQGESERFEALLRRLLEESAPPTGDGDTRADDASS